MKTGVSGRIAMTVAGSDSGGGAGIQADLNTFHAFGVFGACAVTCITAQNPDRILAMQPARPRIVREQMECIFSAFRVGGAKTGMLYNAEIIEAVASVFRKYAFRSLVVDPVLLATSGARLLKKEAVPVLKSELLPQAACRDAEPCRGGDSLEAKDPHLRRSARSRARPGRPIRRPRSCQGRTFAAGQPCRGHPV